MKADATFAIRSPASLVRDPTFWMREMRVVVVAGLALLVGALLTASLSGVDWLAALAIHGIVVVSLVVAIRALARLAVEQAIASEVDVMASSRLRRIEAGESAPPAVEALEAEVLPQNPSLDLGIIRALRQVIKEVKERRSSALSLLLHPYREESFEAIFRLQLIQRSALHLGILGTFIGLISALAQLDLGSGTVEVASFAPLLASLRLAFGTSVAGIEVAVLTSLLASGVRARQDAYFRRMEQAALALRSLARHAENKDDLLGELSEVGTAVRQLGDRILKQSVVTEKQTGVLRDGISRLVDVRDEFYGFLDRLGAEQSRFIGEMRDVYSVLAPDRIAGELREQLERSVDRITGSLETGVAAAASRLSQTAEPLARVTDTVERMARHQEQQGKLLEEANRSFAESRRDLAAALVRVQQGQAEWLTESRKVFPENLQELVRTLGEAGAPARLERIAMEIQEGQTEITRAVRSSGQNTDQALRAVLVELQRMRGDLARSLPVREGLWARLKRLLPGSYSRGGERAAS